jgi:hypothetical protein
MLAGIFFFHEEIVILKLVGGLLIIGAIIWLLYKSKGKIVFNKYLILQFISILAFTIALLLDIGIAQQFNIPIYVSLTLLVPAILIIFAERLSHKKILAEYQQGNKIAIFITGLMR